MRCFPFNRTEFRRLWSHGSPRTCRQEYAEVSSKTCAVPCSGTSRGVEVMVQSTIEDDFQMVSQNIRMNNSVISNLAV